MAAMPLSTLLLPSLCTWCLGGATSGPLDPELHVPYQVHVVLKVAEHRGLTPEFQRRIEAELRDQLQLRLGKLAEVKVSRAHPLLIDLRPADLQAALDKWDESSNARTHFVLIDYVDGQYQIQTGYHDGMTDLSGKVVRREAVGDRQHVADKVAQMVRHDFGVVGTFQKLNGTEVKLAIKGGALVDTLEPWVKLGDVFEVVRMSQEAGKTRASPIEWAILHVVEVQQGGYLRCRYFCRYEDDKVLGDGGAVNGYRCVQLKTIRGPVRVRLVHQKTHEYLPGLLVTVSPDEDFGRDLVKGTPIQGLIETEKQFQNVAFVKVLAGKAELAQFPVPIIDDRIVVCRLAPDEDLVKQGDMELQVDRWVNWLKEALSLAEMRLGELNAELSLDDILKLGRRHLKDIQADADRLAAERDKLVALKAKLDLHGNQYAEALAKRQEQLAKHLDEVDKLSKDTQSDETRELLAKVTRANLLEKQADYDTAIELLTAVLAVRDNVMVKANQQKLQSRLDKLKADWKDKGPDHAAARQFIYAKWPTFDLSGVSANVAEAESSFLKCKAVGDYLTPLKLQLVNNEHGLVLSKELKVLNKAPESLDNRAKLNAMLQLSRRLEALQTQVTEWLRRDKNEAK